MGYWVTGLLGVSVGERGRRVWVRYLRDRNGAARVVARMAPRLGDEDAMGLVGELACADPPRGGVEVTPSDPGEPGSRCVAREEVESPTVGAEEPGPGEGEEEGEWAWVATESPGECECECDLVTFTFSAARMR